MRKSYKALRIMETHKTAEPKFARTLKVLYPHLQKLKDKAGDCSEGSDDENDVSLIGVPPMVTPGIGESIMKGSDMIEPRLDGTCSLSKVLFNDSTVSSAQM